VCGRRARRHPVGRLAGALLALSLAGALAAGPSAGETPLAAAVARTLRSLGLRADEVGVQVMALGSGRVVWRHNATQRFKAASNAKLVTAAAALDALGAGYEFRTALHAGGPVEDGVLRGDLILRGGGDPTLGGRYEDEGAEEIFRRWARVLKARGVARVDGDVVADDSFFDRAGRHPDWADYPAWKWYYGNVSAVSINDNCVTVIVRPADAPGRPALVALEPAAAPVRVLNLCETSAKKHAVWFDREAGSDLIKVGGFVRHGTAGYSHPVTVPDPALYAAAVLKDALEQEGVPVRGRARVIVEGEGVPPDAEPLCMRRAALPAVLRTMLRRSHNHVAEQVIKTVGAETAGRGSWQTGLARAASMLREMGFDEGDFRLADGSGLSRQNELTPELLCSLLFHVHRTQGGVAFAELLAAPGDEGTTLRSRLTREPYRGAVRAKTGYLSGVGALSGYARTRSGSEVAFCILINSKATGSMRERVDALCRAIVDHAE